MKKPPIQPYKDGIAKVYQMKNASERGNMPTMKAALVYSLPFDRQMVGMGRYYQGLQSGMKIVEKIRTPRRPDVMLEDAVTLNGGTEQYTIKQIQFPPEVEPPSMDLSLERSTKPHAID